MPRPRSGRAGGPAGQPRSGRWVQASSCAPPRAPSVLLQTRDSASGGCFRGRRAETVESRSGHSGNLGIGGDGGSRFTQREGKSPPEHQRAQQRTKPGPQSTAVEDSGVTSEGF